MTERTTKELVQRLRKIWLLQCSEKYCAVSADVQCGAECDVGVAMELLEKLEAENARLTVLARDYVEALRHLPGCMMPDGGQACPEYAAVCAENKRLRGALENIAVYGCGMLSMPAAVNDECTWRGMRLIEYERVARAALERSD